VEAAEAKDVGAGLIEIAARGFGGAPVCLEEPFELLHGLPVPKMNAPGPTAMTPTRLGLVLVGLVLLLLVLIEAASPVKNAPASLMAPAEEAGQSTAPPASPTSGR
jgi:hypothetical protein